MYCFFGKTVKTKAFVMEIIYNLFGTDWMHLFKLWDLPINPLCNKVEGSSNNCETLKKNCTVNFRKCFFVGMVKKMQKN